MAYPTTKVEIAFAANWYDLSPTWTDVTSDVRQITTSRGRTSDLQPFDAGTAQIVLDNRARKYDPLNTSGPYYGNLKPRRQIRITADPGTGIGYVGVFKGFTGGFPTTWTDAGYDSTVTVECFDLLGLIADQKLPNDWSQQIGASQTIYFPLDDPESSTILQARNPTIVTASQVAGSVPFRRVSSIASGIDREAMYFGSGITYRSTIYPSFFNNLGNTSAATWWAPDAPNSLSSPLVVRNKTHQMSFFVQATNELRVNVIGNSGNWQCISTTAPLKGFEAHHLAATYNPLTTTIKLYIDGRDVSGTTTGSSTPTTITDGIEVQFNNDILQDVMVYAPNSSSGLWSATDVKNIYDYGTGQTVETTSARLTRYLNSQTSPNVAVPVDWRSFTTVPEAEVSGLLYGTTLTDGINQTTDSEGGEFFVDKAGLMTFLPRSAAPSTASGTADATFNDNGTGLGYDTTLTIQLDDRNLRNDITIQFTAGGTLRTTNTDSIQANGTVASSISTSLSTVAQAQSLADFRRNIDANVVPQLSSIDVSMNTTNAQWATLLDLELINSKIVINRTPSTGSAISQGLVVTQIEHSITPGQWVTRLTGTARYNGWFVLDASALDGPDLLLG